ncbi:hypothetical protein K469DRAFT_85358 [Zopfia rhizophila CBS 207.26]|uniref:Uncharacterized protein n=1 Tax=Zopfia rhizophila CBS 207.26 TaxID=1314779 RepID=A0A6A6EA63_9PEZI|nr:hypothetical protein K469DRAFT_85358 [Zopfia rhizophila CBS 207.26]
MAIFSLNSITPTLHLLYYALPLSTHPQPPAKPPRSPHILSFSPNPPAHIHPYHPLAHQSSVLAPPHSSSA